MIETQKARLTSCILLLILKQDVDDGCLNHVEERDHLLRVFFDSEEDLLPSIKGDPAHFQSSFREDGKNKKDSHS